jgi:hypothetical protein
MTDVVRNQLEKILKYDHQGMKSCLGAPHQV